jgi:hypothetical protein
VSLVRSHRPLRAAGLLLAIAGPVIAAMALPAAATGESASAALTAPTSGSASTFTWTYTYDQNGGHGLSNVAVRFCSPGILADVVSAGPGATIYTSGDVGGGHDGFGPGIKFAVTDPDGTLTVTFAHPHSISAHGLTVQSHSGDGQTGDAITTAAGPGPCAEDEVTTTTSSPTSSSTTSSSTTTSSTTTTTIGHQTTDDPTTTTTTTRGTDDPTTTTSTTVTTTTGTNGTTTTTADPGTAVGGTDTTAAQPTTVLGETLEKGGVPATTGAPASLARTGVGHLMFLMLVGLSLIAAGTGLRAAFHRRMSSASSAG